jgi:hypothetical protein
MPLPDASPFVETDEQASLRRIAECARDRQAKRAAMDRAKLAYQEARESWKKACEEQDQVIDAETTELPLFPRSKDAPAAKAPAPAPGQPDATFLSLVEGFPVSVSAHLGSEGIVTVADLERFLAEGGTLDKFGIADKLAQQATRCLHRHQRRREGGEASGAA